MAMPDGRDPESTPGEEKILWKHEIRKGVFRRRTVGTLAITSQRVIGVDAQIPLQEVNDVIVRNRRKTTTHRGTSRRYPSYGGSTGWEDINLRTETTVTGDIVFVRNGEPAIVFHGFNNPDYLVDLARAARNNLLEILSNEKGLRHDAATICSQCSISNTCLDLPFFFLRTL